MGNNGSSPEELAAAEERGFLHDLANPLSIAAGNVKVMSSRLKRGREITQDDLVKRLDNVIVALDQMAGLLAERREVLLNRFSEP